MTQQMPPLPVRPQPLSYAGPMKTICPLCRTRDAQAKTIYGYPVCKKCLNAFANRRQLAYLLDSIIIFVPALAVGLGLQFFVLSPTMSELENTLITTLATLPLTLLFLMKDGFKGQSVGKMASGVVALDVSTGQPIRFIQSFKRNSVFLVGVIPLIGGIASLVVTITIAVQVGKGFRLGDKFAGTKVIWKKYAFHPMFGGTGLMCEGCGYDLQGNVSGTCPECGKPLSALNAAAVATTLPARE